jgi:DNA repair exonuclease SbcCD ATPase subunit
LLIREEDSILKELFSEQRFHWVIAILFFFWFLVIPPLFGLILLIVKSYKVKKQQEAKDAFENLADEVDKKKEELKNIEDAVLSANKNADSIKNRRSNELFEALKEIEKEIALAEKDAIISMYNYSSYDGIASEECKNKLSMLKIDEQNLIKEDKAFLLLSPTGTKKQINSDLKQIARCFNAECDNALINLTTKNIDSMRSKIVKSYESLNKTFETDSVSISKKLLEIKLEELNLTYTYELKKEQEREEQKAIREQLVEEEKVRRELERLKEKIEKEESQFKNEVKKLMSYMQKSKNDTETELYAEKIKELEEKLKLLEKDKENVLQREQNTRAGVVYIISNKGSFGEDVFKIGMTRRPEPMDRIKELGDASVPFPFDVHAMIFAEDAPALETTLHQTFRKYEVNKVNQRKEFFRMDINEIERVVKENHNATVKFELVAAAYEYEQSKSIAIG